MNNVQFNAIMFLATVVVYSQDPNNWTLGWTIFVSIIFAVSYFSQKDGVVKSLEGCNEWKN